MTSKADAYKKMDEWRKNPDKYFQEMLGIPAEYTRVFRTGNQKLKGQKPEQSTRK